MKFLLFGTGDYYERYKKWFEDEEVLALLDNSPGKQHTIIDGIEVLAPEEGIKLSYDTIIILSFYVKSMREQLTDLGVSGEKIYHFYELYRLLDLGKKSREIQYFGYAESYITSSQTDKKNIVLLSQDLTLGGPALALLHMAEILQKHKYKVVIGSMIDGPLRKVFLEKEIPVVIDENMQIGTMKNSPWVECFSFVLCSTINFYVFLSERRTDIHTIWWLHDSLFFYDGVDKELLRKIDRTNLKVVSVGPVPGQAIHKFVPDLKVEQLVYGVSDEWTEEGQEKRNKDKICFITIGYIEARKGQDLLIKAIQNIPEELRSQAVFYLVGQNTSAMAQHLMEQVKEMPEIQITGSVDRTIINCMLDQADLVICPSREDPMPTVAAEAMMHGVPCLVSDATGTAAYLDDGTDGFLFQSENVSELTQKIVFCIKNAGILREIGERARKVYESYFSMNTFEQKLMGMVDDI